VLTKETVLLARLPLSDGYCLLKNFTVVSPGEKYSAQKKHIFHHLVESFFSVFIKNTQTNQKLVAVADPQILQNKGEIHVSPPRLNCMPLNYPLEKHCSVENCQ